jgi:hypothetical protein
MICGKCEKTFPAHCTCTDRDARLEQVSKSPHVAMPFCKVCNKHSDLCKCPDGPVSELRAGGKALRS